MRSIETVLWTVSVPGCVPPSAEARRANLSICAKKRTSTFVLVLFLIKRFEKGNAKHRNSPVDCFGARVRAAERGSEAGESLHLRQNKPSHKWWLIFFEKSLSCAKRLIFVPFVRLRMAALPRLPLISENSMTAVIKFRLLRHQIFFPIMYIYSVRADNKQNAVGVI